MDTITLQDALKCPTDFLYIFATDSFLSKLDSKSAAIIRKKRRNQQQLLISITTRDGYNDGVKQIGDAIKEAFGYSAASILIKLADGEQVAGKNWQKGIYGIGATYREGFSGSTVTVDRTTGKIYNNGVEVAGQTAIYGKSKGKEYTTYNAVVDGVSYNSMYVDGNYYAGDYTNAEGTSFNAAGNKIGLEAFSDIWNTVVSFVPYITQIITFLRGLFPDLFGSSTGTVITPSNTLPSQSDGFITNGTDWKSIGIFAGIAAAIYAIFDSK